MKNTLLKQLLLRLLLMAMCAATFPAAGQQPQNIELHPVASGTYTLSGQLAPSIKAEFLFDTGASMVMLSNKLFREVSKHQKPLALGKVGAAMASGRVKMIPTYSLPSFVLENGCDVGPVEVAVMRGATRNLIGLNALSKLGVITIDIQNGVLSTSECPKASLDSPRVVAN